jgi:uncharacterized protein (TIGR02145 family)
MITKGTYMHINRIILISAIAAFALTSCKGDETETLKYLTGEPEFTIPAYGVSGDRFELPSKGVTAEDGTTVKYYWYAEPISTHRDTVPVYYVNLTDSLCTVTVHCVAFAEGYNPSSPSHTITIVNSDRKKGSIKGLDFDQSKDFSFTDPRDGREYWCTTVKGTDWFKENLAYRGAGVPLENCESTSDVFGRFYTWDEAVKACPEGWRMSNLGDWSDAASVILGENPDPKDRFLSIAGGFMGNIYFNGQRMWEYWPKVSITNDLRLSMTPMGYAVKRETGTAFKSQFDYAAFWTADEKDGEQAYYRYFYDESPDLFIGSAAKSSFAASVRCVRDHQ